MFSLCTRMYAVCLLVFTLFMGAWPAEAAEVDLRDFILIDRGMSEAEVLYRLGPYDYETVFTDYYQFPIRKRWAYLPKYGRRGWITEITFDSRGRVQNLERYRP